MAHVMLPGASDGRNPSERMRYAEDAIQEMMHEMAALGVDESRIHVCLVGGANVLGDGHDSLGLDIVWSLTEILNKKEITLAAEDVGGARRRSCTLDVACGRVTYTIGDSAPRMLWDDGNARLGPVDGFAGQEHVRAGEEWRHEGGDS
jgi:chemotaxis receptor (MCP) glutamine deamidase CheD